MWPWIFAFCCMPALGVGCFGRDVSLSHRDGSYVCVLVGLWLGSLEVSHLFSWRFLQLWTCCQSSLWGCPAAYDQQNKMVT